MPKSFRKLFPKLSFRLRYLKGKESWGVDPAPKQLQEVLNQLLPGRVLDLGCGRGQQAIFMAQHGWETTGVDFIPEVIQSSKEKAAAANLDINFRVADVTNLFGLDGSFDLITDFGCYHSLSRKKRAEYQKNLIHLLTAGGTYLLYGSNRPEALQPPGITQKDIDKLAKILAIVSVEKVINRRGRPAFWVRFERPITG